MTTPVGIANYIETNLESHARKVVGLCDGFGLCDGLTLLLYVFSMDVHWRVEGA